MSNKQEAIKIAVVKSENTRSDGMPASADERHLRRMLAMKSGISYIYFDDGEASGQVGDICIDFMRDSVLEIGTKLYEIGMLRYREKSQSDKNTAVLVDSLLLQQVAAGMSYNIPDQSVIKHRLNEIAMRIQTGYYS